MGKHYGQGENSVSIACCLPANFCWDVIIASKILLPRDLTNVEERRKLYCLSQRCTSASKGPTTGEPGVKGELVTPLVSSSRYRVNKLQC